MITYKVIFNSKAKIGYFVDFHEDYHSIVIL